MVYRFNIFFLLAITMPWYGFAFLDPIIHCQLKPNVRYWMSISSSGGFSIKSPDRKKTNIRDTNLMLCTHGSHIVLNRMALKPGHYYMIPRTNQAEIEGVSCKGPITVHVTKNSITIRARKNISPFFFEHVWHTQKSGLALRSFSYKVRVLLDELYHKSKKTWTIAGDNGFTIVDSEGNKKLLPHEELHISSKNGALYINNKKYAREWIHIIPEQGFASVNESAYHGSFLIMKEEDRLLLINNVDLEEYVYSVLRTESWPGWPLEVNKVFAIASRSYVMAMMKASKITKLPYHVQNTNKHQTYSGMHDCLTSRAAVDQTRGIFLSYNKEPIVAMFDCCCGGIIPAHIEDFDFKKAPYLARTYPCNHCKECKIYSWQAVFDTGVLHNLVAHILEKNKLKEVKIARKDKAGLVKEVSVKSGKHVAMLTGKQLYSLSKDIKSFCFGIQRKGDKLVFKGRGYGHHLGICQWGAREMVREGWHYKDILQFYYPGTQFLRLTL